MSPSGRDGALRSRITSRTAAIESPAHETLKIAKHAAAKKVPRRRRRAVWNGEYRARSHPFLKVGAPAKMHHAARTTENRRLPPTRVMIVPREKRIKPRMGKKVQAMNTATSACNSAAKGTSV